MFKNYFNVTPNSFRGLNLSKKIDAETPACPPSVGKPDGQEFSITTLNFLDSHPRIPTLVGLTLKEEKSLFLLLLQQTLVHLIERFYRQAVDFDKTYTCSMVERIFFRIGCQFCVIKRVRRCASGDLKAAFI